MLSVVVLLLSLSSGSCKEILDSALSALRQNEAAKSAAVLQAAPSECTQSSSFYELEGVTKDLLGDSTSAEAAFEKAVSMAPTEPRYREELGAAYVKDNKLNKAIGVLKEALQSDPANVAASGYLIAAYVRLQNWPDAVGVFERLDALHRPEVLTAPAMIVWFARSLIETKRMGELGTLLSSSSPAMTSPVLFSLAGVCAESKLYPQVVTLLRRIPPPDTDDAVYFNLGLAYSHTRSFEQARQAYFDAIDLHPAHVDAYFHVGMDYAAMGDLPRAISWVERAHQWAPKRVDISYVLTEQLIQLQYLKSAEEVSRGALKVSPAEPLLLVGAGDIRLAQGETVAAVDLYRKALAERHGSVAALVGLSRADVSQSKDQEALPFLQRALAIDAHNPEANGLLGLIELRSGTWASAVTHLSASWASDQSNAEIGFGLARAYSQTNKQEEAVRLLSSFNPSMRKTPRYHLELSKLYAQLHRPEVAKKEQDLFQSLQADTQGTLRFDKPQSYVF